MTSVVPPWYLIIVSKWTPFVVVIYKPIWDIALTWFPNFEVVQTLSKQTVAGQHRPHRLDCFCFGPQ